VVYPDSGLQYIRGHTAAPCAFQNGVIADQLDSRDIEEGVTADLDADGHVLGIEVLHVRERLGREALASVVLEQLPLAVELEGEA